MSKIALNKWFKNLAVSLLMMSFTTMSFAQVGFMTQLQSVEAAQQMGGVSSRLEPPPTGQVAQNYVAPKPAATSAGGSSEFQKYVAVTVGATLKRFGSDLVKDGDQTFSPPATAAIPGDYLVGPGDEIFLRAWGSVDADMRLIVDRNGQVNIPKVGTVSVSGVAYSNLPKVLQSSISKTYSGVNVSATMGQLRGIRVYVTGYAQNPGAYTVNNLSSLVNVVMAAGGPSTAGSFRNIQLKRAGKVISTFDLYELLLKGDKSADRGVSSEDVIHVGPAGSQVAITGAVNKSAIYEVKSGESFQDLLTYAGGFVSGADAQKVNYLSLATRQQGFKSITQAEFAAQKLIDGDIYLATSEVALNQPIDKQMRMVKIDGQVNKPGLYALKPGQSLQDVIELAGGFTPSAYVYGTRLQRISVRSEQARNLANLKQIVRRDIANLNAKNTSTGDSELIRASITQGNAILSMLDDYDVDGRLSLSLSPKSKNLPPIAVESGDIINVPTRPNVVSILGSVAANSISVVYDEDMSVSDYIDLAGGYKREAAKSQAYLVRASGEFVQIGSWFGLDPVDIYPGDALFIPDDLQKTSWTKEIKDWTSIIYQLGLGAAAIKVLQD